MQMRIKVLELWFLPQVSNKGQNDVFGEVPVTGTLSTFHRIDKNTLGNDSVRLIDVQ